MKEVAVNADDVLELLCGLIQIMAVRSIVESGISLKGDVILALVADEEYASKGTEALLKDYSAEVGIPTVIFGPSGEGLHASTEYVDFDTVLITTKVLIETIVDFCEGE